MNRKMVQIILISYIPNALTRSSHKVALLAELENLVSLKSHQNILSFEILIGLEVLHHSIH